MLDQNIDFINPIIVKFYDTKNKPHNLIYDSQSLHYYFFSTNKLRLPEKITKIEPKSIVFLKLANVMHSIKINPIEKYFY